MSSVEPNFTHGMNDDKATKGKKGGTISAIGPF
jgi:hypothetical protein